MNYLALFGLIAAASAQYSPPTDSPSLPFDCSNRQDGKYGDCTGSYVVCVGGLAYQFDCPNGLVFDVSKDLCDYPESCGVSADSVKEYDTKTYTAPSTTTAEYDHVVDDIAVDLVDCTNLADGFYSSVCSPSYTVCSYGTSTLVNCPTGLLFDQASAVCDYPDRCGHSLSTEAAVTSIEPSTVAYATTTQSYTPDTTIVSAQLDDKRSCVGKPDGAYSLGCVNEFYQCVAGFSYATFCPSGLVFNGQADRCDHSCDEIFTTAGPQPSDNYIAQSTTFIPTADVTVPLTTSTTSYDSIVVTATSADSINSWNHTTTGSDFCVAGDTATIGDCSSKFRRCKNGKMTSARCPGATVFDDSMGLCVYDLPRCKTNIAPKKTATMKQVSYGELSQQYSPPVPVPQYAPALPIYNRPSVSKYLSNPFFVARRGRVSHGRRHHDSDSEEDGRRSRQNVRKGKLRADSRPIKNGGHQKMADPFDGRTSNRVIYGSFRDTFPASRGRRVSISKAHRTSVDKTTSEDFIPHEPSTPAPLNISSGSSPVPVASAANSTVVPVPPSEGSPKEQGDAEDDGSGIEFDAQDDNEIDEHESAVGDVSRRKRSYEFSPSSDSESDVNDDSICTATDIGRLVSLGVCRQDFVFCRSVEDIVRAACPLGELYDGSANRCVSMESCGETATTDNFLSSPSFDAPSVPLVHDFVTLTAPSEFTSTADYEVPSTPVRHFDACDGRVNGPLSLGCSVNYLVCHDGIGSEMVCQDGLLFDESRGRCDYRENIAACGGQPPVEIVPVVGEQQPEVMSQQPTTAAYVHHPTRRPQRPTTSAPLPDSDNHVYVDVEQPAEQPTSVPRPYKPTAPSMDNDDTYVASSAASSPYSPQPSSPAVDFSKVSCTGVANGYYSAGDCTGSYIHCRDNQVVSIMNCPTGLFYDAERAQCLNHDEVASCVAAPVASSAPVITTGNSHSYPDVPMPADTGVVQKGCASGALPVADCSPKYIVCSNGIDFELSCAAALVFSKETRSCEYPEFVAECVASTTASTTVASVDSYVTTTDVTTTTTTAALAEPVDQCVYDAERPSFAISYCGLKYRVCSEDNVVRDAECAAGLLFDSSKGHCVPAQECGRQNEQVPKPYSDAKIQTDVACSGRLNNSLISLGKCRDSFTRCTNGVSATEFCPENHIFSTKKNRCVRRHLSSECRSDRVQYVPVNNDRSSFCTGRVDGLYRDPSKCSGILQCFGGDMFLHQGCTSGLVFNEMTGQCDYRQNVPGCEEQQADPKMETGCRGSEHGAYLADESDCSVFFRCVWDRLERMTCPIGTVFNPTLSVCDWPVNVPRCMTPLPGQDQAVLTAENDYSSDSADTAMNVKPY